MAERLRVAPEPDEVPAPGVEVLWESARTLKRRALTWLMPGRMPAGSVVVLEGDKGVGKSTLLCAVAAHVTGGPKLVGRRKPPAGAVLWCPGEEDAALTVRPRLEAAGADLSRVHFPATNDRGERRRVVLPAGVNQLRAAVDHFGASVLILDPLSAHVPAEVSLIADQDIHATLDPLADLAHATGCTVVCSRNLTKNTQAQAVHRGLGGAAIAGVARAVLRIDWPDRREGRRLLRVVVCNLVRPPGPLEYHLEDKAGAPVVTRVRELGEAADDDSADSDDPGERDVRADARLLLKRLIGNEWVTVRSIESEAEGAGIGLRTLRFAKAELGVRSRRIGTSTPAYWEWGPPVGGWK